MLQPTATERAYIQMNGEQMGTKMFMCLRVCGPQVGLYGCIFEGINTFKRIQMGDGDEDGALLHSVAQGCFVYLRVCLLACSLACVCCCPQVSLSGGCQGQRRWAAGSRDEKVYKINTPDLIEIITECPIAFISTVKNQHLFFVFLFLPETSKVKCSCHP